MAGVWDELDEALGLGDKGACGQEPESSRQPSPLSDRSSSFGFCYEPCVLERDGSPSRTRRRPSKRRARTASGSAAHAPQDEQSQRSQQQHVAPPGPSHAQEHAPGAPQPQDAAAAPLQAAAGASASPAGAAPHPHPQQQQQQQQQQQPAAPPPGGACLLQDLPVQLLLRLLSFLSAQDLAAAAHASPLLRALGDEPVLWRRLFCARWGKPRGPQQLPPRTWKARYVERDLAELAEARARAAAGGFGGGDGGFGGGGGGGAPNMFVEAQLAKRQRALGRAHVDDPMEVTDDVARRVEAWRAARGFAPLSRAAPGGGGGGARAVEQQQGPGSQRQQQQEQEGRRRAPAAGRGSRAAAQAASGSGDAASAGGSPCCPEPQQLAPRGQQQQQQQQQQQREGPPIASGSGARSPLPGKGSPTVRIRSQPRQQAAAAPPRQQQQQQQGGRAGVVVHRWCRVAGTGNVYCCETTGDVHVCDESCTEHVLERSSGLLVCAISGTVRDDLRSVCLPCEGDGDDEEEAAAQMEGDFGGRLARAFELGYYCESLDELERTCFVPRRGHQ